MASQRRVTLSPGLALDSYPLVAVPCSPTRGAVGTFVQRGKKRSLGKCTRSPQLQASDRHIDRNSHTKLACEEYAEEEEEEAKTCGWKGCWMHP